MSDKVIQIQIEGTRLVALTERGGIFEGQRNQQTDEVLVAWKTVRLPPDCDFKLPEEDHSSVLEAIAAVIDEGDRYAPITTKRSAQIWEMVKDFAPK